MGTIKAHADSVIGLGDYKIDPEAELERTEQFALIDTDADRLKVVRLPASVSYSWRSLARGPHAEALILGTDGNLYVIDPNTGATVKTVAVTDKWTEPASKERHQLLLGAIEVTLTGYQRCVDVHLAHVVDDDLDSLALPVGEDVGGAIYLETVIVIAVTTKTPILRAVLASLVLAAPFGLAACSAGETAQEPTATTTAATQCPATPVDVVVSVDQWGDIVSELGGDCARVTTVLASSAVDPHDYEPAPSDAAKFEGAQMVVINGGHYDEWAAKLAASSAPDAPVINALDTSGVEAEHGHEGEPEHGHEGEPNSHVWYSPTAVTALADAVTAEFGKLAPDAATYFDERRAAFTETMKPYDDLIEKIKANASGKTYAATENVFDDMGTALGLTNLTPEGYQVASANETDPAPADLDAFLRLLNDRGVDMLIYNTQTEGSVPQQIRSAAEQAGVPVVEVTETVPPGTDSFQSWQVGQLTEVAKVLGVTT